MVQEFTWISTAGRFGNTLGRKVNCKINFSKMRAQMSVKELNQNPLERLCRQLLKGKKQQPNPEYLYSLQLAKYLLENYDLLGPWAKQQQDLLEQVSLMFGENWKPEKVQKLLHGELSLRNLEEKQKKLQPLGTYLVENLYDILSSNVPKLLTL